MDLGLKEHVALVTGSSQGIGRSTAEAFAREGTRVAVTYRNRQDLAEAVARRIRENGGEAIVVQYDLASDDSIHAAVEAVRQQWGRLDILINNAVEWGSGPVGGAPVFEKIPSEQWRDMLRVNIEGVYSGIQAVLPSMRERRWGRIVTISSGLAVDGMPGSGAYAGAKAAIHGLTRTLYKELAPEGILINVVMAGLTLTDHVLARVPAAMRDGIARSSPIRRLPGPDEVAPPIVFLASPANTLINGEIVRVSGGHA